MSAILKPSAPGADYVIGRGEVFFVDPSKPDDRVNDAVQHLEEVRIERIKGAHPNPAGNRRQRRAAAAKARGRG